MQHNEFSWQNRDGVNIYGQEWRPAQEPEGVVTLIHGLGEHSGRYQHVAEAFCQAGCALLAIDLPGHGKSGGPRGYAGFDLVLDDIDRLLQEAAERFPGRPRFLYGHSMGGAIVLYYTLKRRPELQGVISTSPGLAPGTPVAPSKILMARIMARVAPSFAMANGLDLQNLCHDAALIERYQQDAMVHDRVSVRLGLDLLTLGEWIVARAGEFPVPLLLVQGSGDRIVSPEATRRFAEAVPVEKLTYKVWDGFYHETHNEPEKEQVIHFMVDWVQKIKSGMEKNQLYDK